MARVVICDNTDRHAYGRMQVIGPVEHPQALTVWFNGPGRGRCVMIAPLGFGAA
jgi:hypothetical protein